MVKKEEKAKGSDKILIITIIILILGFALIFGLRYLNKEPEPMTVDDLHNVNADGDLDENQGYIYSNNGNNYSFVYLEGLWFTQIHKVGTNNVYDIKLHYSPRQLDDLFLVGNTHPFLSLDSIYVTFDPDSEQMEYIALSAAELSINLGMVLDITPVAACTREAVGCENRPIINCTNTESPVIFLEESNLTGVSVQKNCIIVSGKGKDLVRATDRLLMNLYSVMD